jgi:hypothetical protein
MTLAQLDDLRLWHQRHGDRPVESHTWNLVLTLWLAGWVGAPTAWLLRWDAAALAALLLVFVPGAYVALRRRLHRQHRLRCDWITALR